ncbi:unnamed protein product [Protopolystoma xenopodis]|uniref:RING-type domain-containing protein n=1 Tax=Protopolystoma xenopodis TaxID=117903 RepID=A0A448WHY6_9PLAT|nr:unnamed protein product [Protopolystoma xenopodis]
MLVKLALGLLPNRPTVSVSGSILIAYRSSSLAELQHMPVAQSFQWCFRHKDPNILKPIFSSQVMEPEVNPAIPNTQNTSQEISVKVDPAPTELADIVACSSEVSHNVEIFNAIREVISCCACLSSQTEMKECTNGHLICQSCFLTLRQDETPQCPTCRANLYSDSRRALVAQKVLSELPTFCPNCGMRMLYKSLSSHRLHFCPKRQVICALTCLGCTWSGSADSFPDHKRSCSIKASLLNRPQEENLTAMLTGFRQRDHSLDTLFHCFTSIFRHFEGHELQTLSVLLSCIRTSGNTLIFRSDHFHANHSKWSLEVRLVLAGPRPASSGSNWLSSGPQAKRARMGESSRGQGHLAAGQEQNNSRLSDDDLAVDAATVTRQSLHELFSDVHEADASSEQASEPGPDEETYRDRRDTFSLPLTSSSSPRRRSRAVGYSNFGDIRVQRQRQSQLVQHPQQHLLFLGPAGRTEFIDSSASVDVMTGGNQMVPEMISRLEQRDDGGMLNVTSRAAVAEVIMHCCFVIK